MVTFRNSEEERAVFVEAIRRWELAYEELHAVYEAKLLSRDE